MSNLLQKLTTNWIPALDGIEPVLLKGGTVAEIRCGRGPAVIALAETYPESTFYGCDSDQESIETARAHASRRGVADRVSFEVAGSGEFRLNGVNLFLTIDSLDRAGDPERLASRIFDSIDESGSWLIVESSDASPKGPEYQGPGRILSAAARLLGVGTTAAAGQDNAAKCTADEESVREFTAVGGFSSLRRIGETRSHIAYEARL